MGTETISLRCSVVAVVLLKFLKALYVGISYSSHNLNYMGSLKRKTGIAIKSALRFTGANAPE